MVSQDKKNIRIEWEAFAVIRKSVDRLRIVDLVSCSPRAAVPFCPPSTAVILWCCPSLSYGGHPGWIRRSFDLTMNLADAFRTPPGATCLQYLVEWLIRAIIEKDNVGVHPALFDRSTRTNVLNGTGTDR